MNITPRSAAVLSLNSCIKDGKFVNLELDAAIKKYGFEDRDKAFFTRLLYGTAEKKLTLDYIVKGLSKTDFAKIKPVVLCIIETGLYQIFYMDRVPDSAACNESTELVKQLCPNDYAGFVNGILRSAVRNKQKIIEHIEKLKGISGLSIRYSVPEWIVSMWQNDYACAEQILEALCSEIPHITLRVNTLKTTAQELCSHFDRELHAAVLSDNSISISGSASVAELYGYREGLFFVQDTASILASSMINRDALGNGHITVVDTCSCPGGKAFSAAINLGDNCDIYAFDLHKNRLKLVDGGAQRLGLVNIHTKAADARTPDQTLFGKADAVICDVPCSGLGVIAKKPDIRYKSFEEVEKLSQIQLDILSNSANYVKKGGFIVYSTCTLRKAENDDVVDSFLKKHTDFELCPTGIFGDNTGKLTFLPHETHTDGFFAAKLARKA